MYCVMFIDSKSQVMLTIWGLKYLEYISSIRIMNNDQTVMTTISKNLLLKQLNKDIQINTESIIRKQNVMSNVNIIQ